MVWSPARGACFNIVWASQRRVLRSHESLNCVLARARLRTVAVSARNKDGVSLSDESLPDRSKA